MSDWREIARRVNGERLSLPGWDEQPFVCRARRPSLLSMAASGRVPNPLLGAVQALFELDDGALGKLPLDEQARAMLLIADEALLEPTLAQLREAGLEPTDEQLSALYVFAMGGAAALAAFRDGQSGRAQRDGAPLRDAAVPADRP